MSRGLRNNNPGNIRRSKARYRGEVLPSQDPCFRQFATPAWGYRAMFVLLDTYRIRHGLDTVRGMLARWAPPAENRTAEYVRTVCGRTGIPADRRLDTRDPKTMIPLVAAMSYVENGVAADSAAVRRGWALFERFRE